MCRSGAVFAAIMVAQGIAISVLAAVMPPEPKFVGPEEPEKLAPISGDLLSGLGVTGR